MTIANCPECGEDLRPGATRCACGWKLAPETKSKSLEPERDPRLCCEIVDGVPCPNFGVYGTSKRYCSEHDPWCLSQRNRREPPPGGFEALKSILKRSRPARMVAARDPEDDLERRAIEGER